MPSPPPTCLSQMTPVNVCAGGLFLGCYYIFWLYSHSSFRDPVMEWQTGNPFCSGDVLPPLSTFSLVSQQWLLVCLRGPGFPWETEGASGLPTQLCKSLQDGNLVSVLLFITNGFRTTGEDDRFISQGRGRLRSELG